MSVAVDVQVACTAEALPPAAELARWAERAVADAPGPVELTVRVVDEPEGADLNQTYRGRDGATNVLSFPFEAPPGTELPLLGDVVVCAPVAEREARAQGKALRAHLAHLVVHGVLHLRGHDHDVEARAEAMEALERRILAELGFPDPYAEAPGG